MIRTLLLLWSHRMRVRTCACARVRVCARVSVCVSNVVTSAPINVRTVPCSELGGEIDGRPSSQAQPHHEAMQLHAKVPYFVRTLVPADEVQALALVEEQSSVESSSVAKNIAFESVATLQELGLLHFVVARFGCCNDLIWKQPFKLAADTLTYFTLLV
jgi:hypothetical protein